MPKPWRLLRSVLFSPGDRRKAMEKAKTLPADALVIDLEDAVGPDSKLSARAEVIHFIADYSAHTRKELIVRVNCPLTTNWGLDDLSCLRGLNIDGVLLPKVENLSSIKVFNEIFADISNRPPLWVMIETAKGVINSNEIASSTSVDVLVFGSNDLTKDMNARQTPGREALLYSMSQLILASRASKKKVIDGVHMDIADNAGLIQSCIQGRTLGFDGKSLIHPNQISAANSHYSPSEHEYKYALRVIQAFDEARVAGRGVCVMDGNLIEHLHVQQAQEIVDIFKQITNPSNFDPHEYPR